MWSPKEKLVSVVVFFPAARHSLFTQSVHLLLCNCEVAAPMLLGDYENAHPDVHDAAIPVYLPFPLRPARIGLSSRGHSPT